MQLITKNMPICFIYTTLHFPRKMLKQIPDITCITFTNTLNIQYAPLTNKNFTFLKGKTMKSSHGSPEYAVFCSGWII